MVVTRRVPAPPAPPASRTPSSQNTPRVPRSRPQPTPRPNDTGTSDDKRSSNLSQSTPRGAGSSDTQDRHSLFSSFSFVIFTLFSLYALSTLHPSPVDSFRHALAVPHDNLIKPYIVPPLKAALSHPAIGPHVTNIRATIHPYAERIETVTRPVLTRLFRVERGYVRPLVRHGTKATYSFIRKSWRRVVIPNYNSYLKPHVQPYLDHWNLFYYSNVDPRLRITVIECILLYNKIQPHVGSAWKTARHYSVIIYSEVAPRAHGFYKSAQPHIIAVWTEAQPHILLSWRFVRAQAIKGALAMRAYTAIAAVRIGDARHEFVDPHIKRIWEKVESRSSSVGVEDPTSSSTFSPEPTSTTPFASTEVEDVKLATSQTSSSSGTLAATPLADRNVPVVNSHIEPTGAVTSDETLKSAASVFAESVGPGAAAEILAAHDSDIVMDLADDEITHHATVLASEIPDSTPTRHKNGAPTKVPVIPEKAEDDVDNFLSQLGISSTEPPSTQPAPQSDERESEQSSTAQEDAAVAAEATRVAIAAKRADIVKRHKNWQVQLDDLYATKERALRKTLVTIRKRAVNELRSLLVHDEHGDKREKVIDSIEKEAVRLVKGVEGYLRKERDAKGKLGKDWHDQLEDRRNKWERVMDKVEEKFAESVRNVQEQVHTWFRGVRGEEVDEVMKAFAELKSVADKAQTNLSVDYAWLEDVTYQDWQNYHDLARTAERFKDTTLAIQNGTHAHPLVDPLLPALDTLDKVVQEVISGFGAQFSMLRSEGYDLYSRFINDEAQDSTLIDFSNSILGKSEEQIKQALNVADYIVKGENEAQADNRVEL
ncbi:hypothetical protein APHAL10511_002241 [Amanita phalloides]|nr:hypothetical protein APHAL10511_002241 [Amanita phalloides]